MRKTITLKDKKIIVRELEQGDARKTDKFRKFINTLVDDKSAQIKTKTRKSLKEEREGIKNHLKEIKKYRTVMLIAEAKNKIIATTGIELRREIQSHVGELGISIIKGYRGIGLGTYLTKEILNLAKKKLKPKPKMIRLGVFSTNKTAQSLYRKMGFKTVAKVPGQFNFYGKLVDEIIMLLKL